MKLQEFNATPIANAQRALKEHYNMPFNVNRLSLSEARVMLNKVRRLMSEAKQSGNSHRSQSNPAYLKMVFMEQALSKYETTTMMRRPTRIVTENEEVEKSQVVLAAQDMIDQVQKFLESVSDLSVKELPALVSSVESEIGVNESQQFNDQASAALTQLLASLTEARTALEGALGIVTGQSGAEAFGADMGAGAPPEMAPAPDMGGAEDFGGDLSEPEEPEADIGRTRR